MYLLQRSKTLLSNNNVNWESREFSRKFVGYNVTVIWYTFNLTFCAGEFEWGYWKSSAAYAVGLSTEVLEYKIKLKAARLHANKSFKCLHPKNWIFIVGIIHITRDGSSFVGSWRWFVTMLQTSMGGYICTFVSRL